jgi:HlyD family secretion protein
MKVKNVVLAGGAAVLLGVGGLALRGEAADPSEGTANAASQAVPAAMRSLEVRAEASGVVEPVRTVEVKSKASGEVLRVYVETGDQVAAGTLLAEIDPRDVQNALDQAAADLESAQVRLRTATAQRQRVESLRQSGVVTQQEYEAAVNEESAARTALVRAQTNHQLAGERRKDVTIRAPIAGTVITRSVEPGQIIASATSNVSGGSTLFTMADLSEIQVRARVDETDIGQVQPGQEARVTVEAYPGRSFTGKVLKMEPQAVVEQNVTMFPVLVRLQNPDGLLKPGMNAEVAVEIASRGHAIAIPNTAIVTMRDLATAATALGLDPDSARAALRPAGARGGRSGGQGGAGGMRAQGGPRGGGWQGGAAGGSSDGTRPGIVFVAAAAKGGKPEPRRVMLGLSDWEYTEVLSGLKEGEKVIPVTGAQLKQKQQDDANRIRQRTGGGVIPGAGGGGGGGPRGGGRGG